MMLGVEEVGRAEPPDWDVRTVDPPGGHVFQSLAWARHRAATGWRPRHLVLDDGSAVLALERPWRLLPGGSAYIPRGPIAAGATAEIVARRLGAVTGWLVEHGIDVVASDAEIPADSGYRALLAELGYRPIEEIQPSRHRMSLALEPGDDEETVFGRISKSTRQRVRQAIEAGCVVVRHDARMGENAGSDFERGGMTSAGLATILPAFYDTLRETGHRRGFALGPRSSYLDWWDAAFDAGHIVHLEARLGVDGPHLAGLMLYRHGGRLSTAFSADDPDHRSSHPGVLHLLRWRAIQLALRAGCSEMDLGGVDVKGVRKEPRAPGDPMYGLYQHKRSFGAAWLELSGAHERVARPRRYLAGRMVDATVRRGARLLRRGRLDE